MNLKYNFIILALVAMILQSCTIINSHRTFGKDSESPNKDAANSYFLPKHTLVVSVNTDGITAQTKAIQDESLLQVSLALSGTSDDSVVVETDNDGFLKSVTSIADDQTVKIIEQISKAIGGLRAGAASNKTAEKPKIITFDPFDFEEAHSANRLLQRISRNSCVEVELVPGFWSGGCPQHLSAAKSHAHDNPIIKSVSDFRPKEAGLYYRRSIHHRVHIVRNGKTETLGVLKFANISPIIRVDVNRSMFVKRETTLTFNKGELTKVDIKKPSELLALAGAPFIALNAITSGAVDALTGRKKIDEARAAFLDQRAKTAKLEREILKAELEAIAAGDQDTANQLAETRNGIATFNFKNSDLPQNPVINPKFNGTIKDSPLAKSCLDEGLTLKDCATFIQESG